MTAVGELGGEGFCIFCGTETIRCLKGHCRDCCLAIDPPEYEATVRGVTKMITHVRPRDLKTAVVVTPFQTVDQFAATATAAAMRMTQTAEPPLKVEVIPVAQKKEEPPPRYVEKYDPPKPGELKPVDPTTCIDPGLDFKPC